MTGAEADQLLGEASALANEGLLGEAASLYQTLVRDIGREPEFKARRVAAYSGLLKVLFAEGRDGRMSKAFRQYVAEHCEIQDPAFDNAYLAGVMATRTAPVPLRRRDRFQFLVRKLESTLALEGRVAECGCFRGLSSFLLCSRLRQHDPAFDGTGYEIYDSFQGLSEAVAQDTEAEETEAVAEVRRNMRPGMYAAPLEHVQRSLAAFPRIAWFPGWIPAAFDPANAGRYRFAHVDVDLYQPTRDSFEYFWPRLVPGGVIVCDDYNWPGAKRAVEAFCAEAGVGFETTPSNQAWFAKPA